MRSHHPPPERRYIIMKDKTLLRRIVALSLIFTASSSLLASCVNDGDSSATSDSTTPADTTTSTPESTTPQTENTTEPNLPKDHIVSLKWSLGYVGSDSNPAFKDQLNPNGSMYSYSEIINLGKKGATITFTDDNTNSNGDKYFASAAAYVFSSWKYENDTWVLDTSAYNANGTDATYIDHDGKRTYSYTSSEDNECIRLCFRSGQSASFTPSDFPAVIVSSTDAPTVEKESDPSSDTDNGTKISVQWHAGYVGSSTNSYGYANKIKTGGSSYSYTDVIKLEKKGTKITFTDKNNGSTSSNAYVISFWKQVGNDWQIDLDKTNIPGGGQYVISKTNSGTVYTYISSSDNEYVRFCFRSNGVSNAPSIYISETNEAGTADSMVSELEKLEKWLEENKNDVFYHYMKGKTFTVIGDSYLAGSSLDKSLVWPAILAKKYDMVYNNYGVNGSTMSNYVTTNNPMVDRFSSMADNDPDIVIIEGGRNDYNKSVPIGENGSTDTKTMKGAARTLIEGVKNKYPNALIICVTVWEVGGSANSAGYTCSDYGKALIEVCEDMNVPCINAMDQEATGVYMTNSSFREQYCLNANDISHLNAEGMRLVFPFFENKIAYYMQH